MLTHVATVALAASLAACGSSPTQPSSTPSPSSSPTPTPSPTSGATSWNITQRFVSVDGPDNCWVRLQRQRLTGLTFADLATTITRTGTAIRVDSIWFQVNYTGTFNGSEFAATGAMPLTGGGTSCDGLSFQQQPGVSNLTGRFAEDDRSLTAAEANSYRLTSGELVTYTWAWSGVR